MAVTPSRPERHSVCHARCGKAPRATAQLACSSACNAGRQARCVCARAAGARAGVGRTMCKREREIDIERQAGVVSSTRVRWLAASPPSPRLFLQFSHCCLPPETRKRTQGSRLLNRCRRGGSAGGGAVRLLPTLRRSPPKDRRNEAMPDAVTLSATTERGKCVRGSEHLSARGG